ncbi:diadenosine tetraphosphatase [Legionella santicrucis]|uniref:Diadenosine tetraphosphatase n=1 Tax=Legionella santicrucis TaxID=45074 RepID=A0A0W0Z453_9GAMM|nr:metallophosphoesterase [Legionella santicrucis]KTD63526.1 diadenosine tetraphosphatase [Legionella santicrucis]
MKEKIPQDIILKEENTVGSDIIIGDVHGNANCFKQDLESLSKTDRLFIVGDLTDRGHNSREVMRQILKHKEQVFSIRGNHEDLCLATINSLERLTQEKSSFIFNDTHPLRDYIKSGEKSVRKLVLLLKSLDDSYAYEHEYKALGTTLINGGRWMIQLFLSELENKSIQCQGGTIQYQESSEIKSIKTFMEHLPYIIHVKGKKPFNIVHADMPFEDVELYKRIANNNMTLTNREKSYTTWARQDDPKLELKIRTKKRHKESIPSYVGHTPIVKEEEYVPIVRYDSNTVNLDVGTYASNVSLAVNHTKGCSEYIGKKGKLNESMLEKQEELNQHLQKNPYNPSLYKLDSVKLSEHKENKHPSVKSKHEKQVPFNFDSFWKPHYERINEDDKQDNYLNRDEDNDLKPK